MNSQMPLADTLASLKEEAPFAIDPAVLETIPAAVYVCSADGRITQFNRRAAELWGRSPRLGDTDERFCGAHCLYEPDGNHLPHDRTPMATVLRTGEPQHDLEVLIERPDGSRITASVHIEPLKDERGRVIGAVNCFQDITERKRGEEEVRLNRADMEDFFENSVFPMHWVSGDGIILRANRAELDLLGYDRTEYVGRHIAEFHADHAAIDSILQRLTRGQLLDRVPAQLRAKDGSIKDVLISSSGNFPKGKLANTRCVTVDITERKRVEQTQRRLAAIVESSDDAIVSKDLNGVVQSWNPAAERLFGYSAEEMIGRPISVIVPPDRRSEVDGILTGIRRGERIDHYETVRRRKDGRLVDISLTVSPLIDADGEVVGASKVARDITERKRAEATLARSLEEHRILFALTDRLHRAQALEEVYEASLAAIQTALQCQRASILLFDDAGVMRFAAWRGLSDAYRKAVDGHSPWSPDATDPQPICVDDITHAGFPDELRTTIQAEGVGALAFVPLVSEGRLLGKFMAYYDAPHAFTDRDIELAVTIARQLGFAAERIRASQARRVAEMELRESEAREHARANELQSIMEAAPAVIWIARDAECRVIDGNPASFEFLRLARGANPSLSAPKDERPDNFRVFVDGRELAPEELPVQRAARGEEVRNFLEETRFRDGASRYLFGNATPLRDAEGKPNGSVAAFVDITDRIEAEKQRDLMIAELNHRVKNTLATVISIARQSFSRDRDVEDALASFNGRIRALAQTHTRLAESNWSGVSLESLLLDEFAPYRREDGGNVRVSGPTVLLAPRCALTLGMTIHELTTNAAKHGALSSESGAIDVVWGDVGDEDRRLRIRWTESDGPKVSTPSRTGFGRFLIERALAADLGGDVRLDFVEDGLQCAITIPFDRNVTRVC